MIIFRNGWQKITKVINTKTIKQQNNFSLKKDPHNSLPKTSFFV
jgi:hypothetical protein